MGSNPALTRWAARAIQEVTLPTGTRIRLRIPSPGAIVRSNAMPPTLRKLALQIETGSVKLSDVDEDQMIRFTEMSNVLVAQSIRAIHGDEPCDQRPCETADHWSELTLSGAEIDDLGLPFEDTTAIEAIVLRSRTPAQITAAAIKDLGLAPALVAAAASEAAAEEEAGGTVDAWTEFRGESSRPSDGPNGAAVRAELGAGLLAGGGPDAGAADR